MKNAQLLLAAGYSRDGGGTAWLAVLGGALLMLTLGSTLAWKTWQFWTVPDILPLVGLSLTAFALAALISSRLRLLPKAEGLGILLGVVTLAFICVVAAIALGRFYYSRSFLLVAYLVAVVWLPLIYFSGAEARKVALAVIPGGMSDELLRVEGGAFHVLQRPHFPGDCSGIAVDLHQRLSPEWIRFLADCALQRIPVYHAAVVFEAATGRVSLSNLNGGVFEELRPEPIYAAAKRWLEVMLVLAALPLVVPLCLILAVVIRFDSSGPVIFSQERRGQNGTSFRLYKFRSMRHDQAPGDVSFTSNGDGRVTRIGRFIRKVRADELPQLWNVIRGDMSLVGPRPEQIPYAMQFDQEIPFYSYRHLVRPGITGWAQVNHGYAADLGETRSKLEYDLYYVKYLSFWLDLIILLRTLRIVLTGFGAR